MIITIGTKIKDNKNNTYLIKKVLGQGGFGCVFLAEREGDARKFAVKTLLNAFTNEGAVRAFKNEIIQAGKIVGDNIIRYEFVHNGEVFSDMPPYIIMEYAEGGTLKALIDDRKNSNKPFSKDELLSIYKQLVLGMKVVNTHLVHRDIKPDNILISNNTLKITDFGLSKVVDEITRSKSLKGYGTLAYIAPEAWMFEKNTIQMDIYSMGIVFYELAVLDYPYDIGSVSEEGYRKAHMFSGIKNISLLRQRTNPSMASIVLRMLEKASPKRFSNWDEILCKLDNDCNENSSLSKVVSAAISTTLQRETAKQQAIAEAQKKKEEEEEYCLLVKSQFETAILSIINSFTEDYNTKNAGADKSRIINKHVFSDEIGFQLYIPHMEKIEVALKIIQVNSVIKTIPQNRYYGSPYMTIATYPCLRGQQVIGWVEIKNSQGYGFNIALVKTKGIYGEWYILENKNNFSLAASDQSKVKKEPFAFGLNEVSEALRHVDVTGLYSCNPIPFTEEKFLEFLSKLF